jgi:hypothetical protein
MRLLCFVPSSQAISVSVKVHARTKGKTFSPPRQPRHGRMLIFSNQFFLLLAGPQVFGSPCTEEKRSASAGGGPPGGKRVQGPPDSRGPAAVSPRGRWVSRRRYRKQVLRTQTSCPLLDFSRRARRDDVGAETGVGGGLGSVGQKTS